MATNRRFQRSVAFGLALCLLLLSGPVYAQSVEHAAHHTHHQGAAHATALCSWACAAGQGLEGVEVILQVDGQVFAAVSLPAAVEPSGPDRPASPSRGPPVSLV